MIIKALSDYYDILQENPENELAPLGYSMTPISYFAVISESGELMGFSENKREVPIGKGKVKRESIRLKLPARLNRASIIGNFLCDNGKYMFGITYDKKTQTLAVDRKSFDSFKDVNTKLLENAEGTAARAIMSFLSKWQPEENLENEMLLTLKDDLSADFLFCVEKLTRKTNEDEEILSIWENQLGGKAEEGDRQRCAVSGELLPIARLHNKIKNVMGAQSSGATLVSFNSTAETSYNKEQSYNSMVSETIMFKYTTALNWLLQSGSKQKIQIGQTTTVFWAESASNKYVEAVDASLMGFDGFDDDEAQQMNDNIYSVLKQARQGKKADYSAFEIDEDTRFHILGLSPNASRLSVRYYYDSTFGKFMENIMKHYEDTEIDGMKKQISIKRVLWETISPKSTDKNPNPLLSGALTEAIISGKAYPESLLTAIVRRVKTDCDKNISYTRAGILKGCLNRKNKFIEKEKITMALNEESTNNAYLLGRLFAVLERVQMNAIQGVKATIKDRYFSSACSTPSSTFPTLLKLAQSHLSKLEKSVYFEKLINEIMGKLDCDTFPNQLLLDEQGSFIIGYYHQNQQLWKPAEAKNNEKGEN